MPSPFPGGSEIPAFPAYWLPGAISWVFFGLSKGYLARMTLRSHSEGYAGFLGLLGEVEGRKIRLKRPSEETPKSKRTIEISFSGLFVELSQDLLGLSKAYLRFPYMAPPKAHWVTSLLGNASPQGTLDFWGGPRRPKVNQGNPKMGQDYLKMAPS